MNNKQKRRFPLQIAISTLFILVTIILGTIISLQNYNKASGIILSSADKLYTQITQELYLDFKATYAPISGTLQLLSQSPVSQTKTLEERLQYIKTFKTVLESNESVFSGGIAFPNGDFFSSTLISNDLIREHFEAPREATLLVLHISRQPDGSSRMQRLYYNNKLQQISSSSVKTDFNALQRPWYLQATETPQSTSPYLFYQLQIVGLTAMMKTEQAGVVVYLDITLQSLSDIISKYKITANSEVVLINSKGETLAYKNPEHLITRSSDKEFTLSRLHELNSDVLTFISQRYKYNAKIVDFEFNGERWIGSSSIVAKPGGDDLFALMITPVDELLKDASSIRMQSLYMTLGIILLFIPVIWLVARRISTPLKVLATETENISHFEFTGSSAKHSRIKEVGELQSAMDMMSSTINKFLKLIRSLAGEQNLDTLIRSITLETKLISQADGALTYLLDETDNLYKPGILIDDNNDSLDTDKLPELTITQGNELLNITKDKVSSIIQLKQNTSNTLSPLLSITGNDSLCVLLLPLNNRNNETIGLLCLLYEQNEYTSEHTHDASIAFVEALSGFAAVTLESRQMLSMQEALLNSFIKLIAGAIDSKSPYTGGHCQRVPEITFLLAQAACDSEAAEFKDFMLNDKQWQALEIACWLHDCGKVTTPEYVVDKSTKLETIYDRIHEIRMRFEVLKRDAEIDYWQQLSRGDDKSKLKEQLKTKLNEIDNDFAFIAECNEGGEFMEAEKIQRLRTIASYTWSRTLDDRIGISWEELNRKNKTAKPGLPVEEKLLSDKIEHIIERTDDERIPENNPWGFKLDTPEHKYNRGELYNLSIKRGTLSKEERFKINEHMVQTIIMLNKLPYPKHMKDVPDIAGCHHETLDGKGYPKRLTKEQTPITGRMMAIADIFEALTASDRPYKKPKPLSEAIRIMSFMKQDNHIDSDLFDLFLSSGAYLKYAHKFLHKDQIDEVDINAFISSND